MSFDKEVVIDILEQISEAIVQIENWSEGMTSGDDYASSPESMKTLAATCMLLEAIGEGIKKIDKRTNGTLLYSVCPEIQWKNIIGMRNHIAHGYFGIDADFVYDAVNNDLHLLQEAIHTLMSHLKEDLG